VSKTKSFWDSFYKDQNNEKITDASSFARFVCDFVKANSLVIDMGCGNGRDSRYLNLFNDVVGIDQSDEAIESCRAQGGSIAGATKTLDFRVLSVEDENICQIFKTEFIRSERKSIFVYARFFLHAIDKTQYARFWDFAQCLNRDYSVSVGVEFRTNEDEKNFKQFPGHFRTYLDPNAVVADAELRGFRVREILQGYGLAKYKDEDPHLARIIFD
jgi:SAM-dependent methyltransferase